MKLSLSLILFLCLSFSSQAQSAYGNGEWLSFKIKYGWFNTSKASLEVQETTINGQNVLHVVAMGKSVGLLDVFFKVRDRYETYIDANGLPIKFIRDINEGGYEKHKELYFEQNKRQVKVIDFKHDTNEVFDIKPNTQDMLSAFYKLRNSIDNDNLKVGQEFYLNMFFDNKNYDFKTRFLGYETLDTKFGKIDCLKFRPYVMADRVFEESESLTFWVTADKNKIPIKIQADLAVGSLIAELNEFKGLMHSFKINTK